MSCACESDGLYTSQAHREILTKMFDFLGYWTTFAIASCCFLYWLMVKDFDYWEKRGVYFLKPKFFFGNIKDRILMRISYHEFQKKLYFQLKGYPYAGLFEGRSPNLMVLDPDLIKAVLIRDFDHYVDRTFRIFKSLPCINRMILVLSGGEWKSVRSAMTPTFSTGKIKAMFDLVTGCADQLVFFMENAIKENDGTSTAALDVKETMGKFTLDVIANCAFGVQCDSLKDPDAVFSKEISKFNDLPLWKRIIMLSILICQFPPQFTRLLPLSFMNEKTALFLGKVVKDTVKYRQDNNIRRNDFLQLLMDVAKEDEARENKSTPGQTKEIVEVMDEDTMIAQCILFFLAGFETSSTLLSMACYELAQNKKEQDTLRGEIKNVLSKHGNNITYEAISDMPYLDMVLSETLRMYPPVARIDRVCTDDHKLGDLEVKKGTRINIPVLGLHYDPDYYPDPQIFRPERFSPEAKAERSPYVFLPFGVGPRNCIGLRFAQMSSKICMVYLLKDLSVQICEETVIPFAYHKRSMLLKPKQGVWLKFSKVTE